MSETTTKFTHVIDALLDYDQPFPPRMLRSFSDLTPLQIHELKAVWPEISDERKISLLEDLENIEESDTLVCFDELAKFSITDSNPAVRVLSIRLLWDCEETRLISTYIEMMHSDPAEDVRAAAASALGKFVLMGELETISDSLRISSVQNLIDVVNGPDLPMVRRRALESLGYSGHPKVSEMILKASEEEDTQWIVSALYAMGRSGDENWANVILNHLESKDSEILFEAIRSAGELQLEEARDLLMDKLEEINDDPDMRIAIIWSLSQIGGDAVKKKLEELAEKCSDDDEAEWLEKALDNLELGGQLDSMEMIEFDTAKEDKENSEGLDETDDLDDFDEDEDEILDVEDLDENSDENEDEN
jgi:HEAT repeat protein